MPVTKPKTEVVALMLRVSPDVAQALREQALAERRTMSNVATYAILAYIEYAKEEAERLAKKRSPAIHRSTLKGIP